MVDILGDEYEGNRLAALDELEQEVNACYEGEPSWEVMRALQPTIRERDLPREPFLRLIEANRMDQRISQYVTWADLKQYCVHSADPVGRLLLGVLGRNEPELVALSDDVCTGLQLVNFLQDVPRDLALGRIYLPAEDRRHFLVLDLKAPNWPLRQLLEFEAERARGRLASGEELGDRLGGDRPRGRALRPGRPGRAGGAGAGRLGHLHATAAPVAGAPGPGGDSMRVEAAYAEVERITRREARNFAYGIMVLPRPKRRAIAAIYAFARRVDDIADGELADDEKRAQLQQLHADLDAAPSDPVLVALGTRARVTRSRPRRCTTSSTAAFRTPSNPATRTSRSCSATAAGSRAPWASHALRCTAPRTRSARSPSAWPCS